MDEEIVKSILNACQIAINELGEKVNNLQKELYTERAKNNRDKKDQWELLSKIMDRLDLEK